MSGGRLVLLDRLGRDARAFPLAEGLATIGSDPGCDIRLLLPTVSPHHATVVVHANQFIDQCEMRSMHFYSLAEAPSSARMAVLSANVLTVVSSMAAGELLVNGAAASMTALRHGDRLAVGGRMLRWDYDRPPSPASARRGRSRRHSVEPRTQPRASLPASARGRQVAVVQPQRRDADPQGGTEEGSPGSKRARLGRHSEPLAATHRVQAGGPSRSSLGARLTTKASLWIESRKRPAPRRVTKIRAPARIDHTKQAAIMLMAGHTPKPKTAKPRSLVVLTKPTPRRSRASRGNTSSGTSSVGVTPGRPERDPTTIFQSTMAEPKKSALKNPSNKRSIRKTESIKFNLSSLEQPEGSSSHQNRGGPHRAGSDEDLSLHYSDSSASPSPRIAVHSRSSRMLQSLGTSLSYSPAARSSTDPVSPSTRKFSRGSLIVERALENLTFDATRSARGTIETLSDQSYRTTVQSAQKSRTRSTRAPNRKLGAYSTIDLISSMDSNESGSLYGSAGSEAPPPELRRRAASLTTPENSQSRISLNSTRIPRASRSRSRINDSDAIVPDGDVEASPRSSRRVEQVEPTNLIQGRVVVAGDSTCPILEKVVVAADFPAEGTITPEDRYSPEEATTPVLNIQNLLDRSSSCRRSRTSQRLRQINQTQRKTIGGDLLKRKTPRLSIKSRSLLATSKRASRARKEAPDPMAERRLSRDEDQVVTPTSAVKLVQEAVKNKHSSAKKTQSKRAIIDNLDESDIVKQFFNSPVKRKLSQSMTEFSRKKFLENEEDESLGNKIALESQISDASTLEHTEAFTPEVFVSPLSTPQNSLNVTGLKRLFGKNTRENNLRNVKGVSSLLRSPLSRRSINKYSTNVSGVKELFASSPKDDLSRMSGVKYLFRLPKTQNSPKNSLENLAGVKELLKNSVLNDLRNVSGVKTTLRLHSLKNDLADVRGLKRMYRGEVNTNNLSDFSGVEELFEESKTLDRSFDQLSGNLRVRSYPRSKSLTKVMKPKQRRNVKSLHDSIGLITDNVEEWLENELKKRFHRDVNEAVAKKSSGKTNLTRELQNLTTHTVEGSAPLLEFRSRNGTMTRSGLFEGSQRKKSASEIYSAHTLPIKKRSLARAANRNSTNVSRNRLPIKKRMLVHSTPVKGTLSVTMNASELGRVSPIASVGNAVDTTNATVGAPKQKRGKSSHMGCEKLESVIMRNPNTLYPKKTGGTKSSENSPVSGNGQKLVGYSRRNIEVSQASNSKKRRVSVIVTKKKPVLSPKSNIESLNSVSDDITNKIKSQKGNGINTQNFEEKSITPRKTRANTRKKTATVSGSVLQIQGKFQSKVPKTPKNTRAKTRKSIIGNTKLSTQMKQRNLQRNVLNEVNSDKGVTKTDVKSRRVQTHIVNVNNTDESRRTRNGNKKAKTDGNQKVAISKQNNLGDRKLQKQEDQIVVAVDNKPELKSGREVRLKTIAVQTENTAVRNTRRNKNKVIETSVIEPSKNVTAPPNTRKRERKGVADKLKLTIDKSPENIITGRTRRGAKSKETIEKAQVPVSNNLEKNVNNNNDNVPKTRQKNKVKADSQEDLKTGRARGGKHSGGNTVDNGEIGISDKIRKSVRNAKENKTRKLDKRVGIIETDTEPVIVRKRTRQAQKENKMENTVSKGKKNVVKGKLVESGETVVKKTRNARGVEDNEHLETRTGARGAPSKGKESGSQTKTTQVSAAAPRRARKNKMEVNETEALEAPAKRPRTTRAATAAASADGRSRSRR